jgi:Cytochrome c554 and c-prime
MVTSLSGILTSKVHLGEWQTWGRKRQPGRCPSVSGRTIQSIDFVPKSGYKQDDYPKMRTVNCGRTALRMAECLIFAILIITSSAAQNSVVGKYNGPGGCASSSCHGSIQPKQITRVPQNEYSIWAGQDKHARAYQVLSSDGSVRMGRILNLKSPPNQNQKCLACHALSVSPEMRAQSFDISDGVSCEHCHGPAAGWLGAHTVKDWETRTADQKAQLGMRDLRDLAIRSHTCLHCHVGTEEQSVDHQMIAAGHPDLTFELNLFSAVMPRHWKDSDDAPWFGTKEWAVGQGMQLRDSLQRLARRARSSTWPEYSELDCFACHHSLTAAKDSWRQEIGYDGRTPGVPAWNSARFVVFHYAAAETDSSTAGKLESEMATLSGLMGQLNGDREQIAASADRAAELAHSLTGSLNSRGYDQAFTLQVMRKIAGDSRAISQQGQRAGGQAAMSLDSLFGVYKRNAKNLDEAEIKVAITGLFQQLDDPSAYNAPRFAAQMQKVSALLSPEKGSR